MSTGDLQHFVAKAEMAPIMRSRGGLTLSSEGKEMVRRVREKFGEGVVAVVELEIAKSIAERGMEYTAELIDHAINLAGGNDKKFEYMMRSVDGFGRHVGRVQRRASDPFAM